VPEKHTARLYKMVVIRQSLAVFVIILPFLMAWLFNLVIDVFNLVI